MNPTVSVIGVGAWGSALAQHLARKGSTVCVWTRDAEKARALSVDRRHPKWRDQVLLDSRMTITSSIEECALAPTIVLASPSKYLSEVISAIGVQKGKTFVSAIKGMEPHSELTPLQFCAQSPALQECSFAVVSGPSFASDVIFGRPVSVVCASNDESVTQNVATLFMSDTMRVYTSSDPLGVELGGIVKNIVAIAAGVSDSLGNGPSGRAGLITRGLAEMKRLALALGAKDKTLSGLSGLGDLIMTATEDQSRNRSVGLRLGKGEKLEDILATLGSEAEGPTAAPCILNLGRRNNVDMPITEGVVRLLRGEMDAPTLAKGLMSRPMKAEF